MATIARIYCHAPHGATLATLVRIAGRRWPVETCFQAAKSILGIDTHQVRLWHSWHRHTVLTLLAAAILAVATAAPAEGESTAEAAEADTDNAAGNVEASGHATASTLPAQPAAWRKTGTLPVRPDQPPPADHGMIKVTIAEARRLLAIAANAADTAAKLFHLRWSDWRRPPPSPRPLAPLANPPTQMRNHIGHRRWHQPTTMSQTRTVVPVCRQSADRRSEARTQAPVPVVR